MSEYKDKAEGVIQQAVKIQNSDSVRLRLALSMAKGTPRVSTAGGNKKTK